MKKYKFTLHYYDSRHVIKYVYAESEDEAYEKIENKWGHLIFEYEEVELVEEGN
jgi:hypothetical protein